MDTVRPDMELGAEAVRSHSTRADATLDFALERTAFMQDVAAQLVGSLNVRRTVLTVLHMATPYLGDWAMVCLFDGPRSSATTRGAPEPGANGAVTGPIELTPSEDEQAGLDRIRRAGHTELLHVGAEPDLCGSLAALIPEGEPRAQAAALRPDDVLGVALKSGGVIIGVLVLVRGANGGYDERTVELVEEFATSAATALDSARRYEDRTRVAAVLQASLRPPRLPEVAGARIAARYRPAQEQLEIGGDFYDVHGDDEEYSLVIGDVCGKGVHAAVLTGRARQTIRTAAYFDRSPSTVLAALNDVLYDEDSDRFVTVACAHVRPDADTGGLRMRLAVAGHPAPFVLRADGRVEQPEASGTLSGVLPQLSYVETEVALLPGDTVLFYTDGIYEAKGPEGFFGMDRLRAMLSGYAGVEPDVVCEAIEQRVVEHLDGADHDDMALLALRCGE